MHPDQKSNTEDDMRPEYDFSGGVRGKHYQAYRQGTNLVPLDPDVAQMFPDPVAVNEALRLLVRLAKQGVPSTAKAEIG
ncbi:MAG: hypothetical protein AB1634_11345 [Thermodesulfobacteriota bacterium]